MRPSHGFFLLGVLAGGAATLVLGAWVLSLQGTRTPAEADGVAVPSSRVEAAERGAPSDGLVAPGEAGRSAEAASTPTRRVDAGDEPSAARVRELIAAVGEAAPTDGSGSIWGRVRDAEGVGLEGVVLRAQGRSSSRIRAESPSRVGQGPPPPDDLEEVVRSVIESRRDARARLYETTTDASGAYRFEGLPDGPWRVEAYKRDWVLSAAGGLGWEVPLGTELDFEGAPVLVVPVEVVLPGGARAESAVIRVDRPGERRTRDYAWSPAEPILRLTPGRFELTALAGAFATSRGEEHDLKSEAQTVELVAGVPPAPLRFELEGRAGIRGRLRLPSDGLRGVSPRVLLMPLGAATEPDLAALAESDQSARGGLTFEFLDLEPGRYVVGASRGWGAEICAHAVVTVTDTIVACELEIPPVDLARNLVATVLGADGRTLDGVDFHLTRRRDGGSSGWGIQPLRLDDGRYLIALRQEYREAYFSTQGRGDRFGLRVSHSEHGSRTVELTPGQVEVLVSFAVPARLEVTIAGYAGSALAGRLTVLLEPASGDDTFRWTRPSERLSPDGVQVFDAVEPGSYRLRMLLAERGSSRRSFGGETVGVQPVELVAGENSVSLPLPVLYEVVVSHPQAEPGTRLYLSSEADLFGGRRVEVDDQRRAVISDVSAGRYTLRSSNPYGQMEIDVPCGVVQFEAQVMNALRVSVTDPAGALAVAGLADGDLIVAVNGEELASEQDFFLLYRKSEDYTLTVLRGGRRVDVPIERLDARDASTLGGSLTPTTR